MIVEFFQKFVRWIGYDLGITPNQITWGRLFVFVPGWLSWIFKEELAAWSGLSWLVFGYLALVVVTIVIIFDIVDGALARETGNVSAQGKVIDPLVDKLITYSTLALFWGSINRTGFVILLILDIASTFLRGVQIEGANQFGKKKALSQNISKFFFGMAVLAGMPWLNHLGNMLIWLAVILASISVCIRVLPKRTQNGILVLIPQALTLGNLAAGFGSIWCALDSSLELGVLLNFMAMAFDLSDGAAARKLGVSSRFGGCFDTVADFVSFGAAPAILVGALNGFSSVSMFLGCLYVGATCLRLYDYGRSKDSCPTGFFRGVPSPAGAWLVVSSVLFEHPDLSLAVLIIAAILMCLFFVNWIHFSKAIPNLLPLELVGAALIALLLSTFSLFGAITVGPILIYLLSPLWRRPEQAKDAICNLKEERG